MFKVLAVTENNKSINEACIECFGGDVKAIYGISDIGELLLQGWVEIKDDKIIFYID